MTRFNEKLKSKAPSQRQLQVGEEIRHILSSALMRGEVFHPDITSTSVTVSEVRISPDLKNATAYILPLGGNNKEAVLKAMNDSSAFLRHLVSKSIRLRQAPRLGFRLDASFDTAGHINELLNRPEVARDLGKAAE